jgi:histidine triad (HIT) family protein
MSTIFTKIIHKEIPAYVLYEDELVISFLDISQATVGHTLVVTKKPYEDLFAIDEETLSHLMSVTLKIAKAVKKAFNPQGLNLLQNNGSAAGQTVFHFHVHIIPRYDQDELKMSFPNHMQETSKEMYLDRVNRIKEALL